MIRRKIFVLGVGDEGGEGRPVTYKRTKVRTTAEFYLETGQASNSIAVSLKNQKKTGSLKRSLSKLQEIVTDGQPGMLPSVVWQSIGHDLVAE